MKKSKRGNPPNLENGVDFISNMPDPILQLILQGLPNTEEVVRTSILSTRWRYLWTSIPYFPSLNLDCDRVVKAPKKFKKNKFKKFVSWALANETVDLDSFRLRCDSYYTMSNVINWIRAAITRKVKSLGLRFYPGPGYMVFPDCLVTCDSLEVLRLSLHRSNLRLPSSQKFGALRVLELNNLCCLYLDAIAQFVRMSPLLEELTLIDCLVNPLIISSPKLKTLIIRNCKQIVNLDDDVWFGVKVSCPELMLFEYIGPICPLNFENLDSLKKAVILPDAMTRQKISSNLRGIRKWLAAISHVESLSLNFFVIRSIQFARDRENFPASFPNLKTLELTTIVDAFIMNIVIRLLRCSPNLESFHLTIQMEHLRTKFWALDEVETSRILTQHLKTVKFLGFNGEKRELVIARFLLEHGNTLEEMVFSWSNQVEYNEKSMETMNEVSKLYKASSNALQYPNVMSPKYITVTLHWLGPSNRLFVQGGKIGSGSGLRLFWVEKLISAGQQFKETAIAADMKSCTHYRDVQGLETPFLPRWSCQAKSCLVKFAELGKLIRELKQILYGNSEAEPVSEACAQLTQEFFRENTLRLLIICLPKFKLEVRKDATQVVSNLQRQQVQSRLIACDYLEANSDLMDILVSGYEDHDMALHYGAMLRECIRHQSVARYVLESEHVKKFFKFIQLPNFDIAADAALTFKVEYVLESEHVKKFFKFIQLPNFDIAADAALTFKELMTRHKSTVAEFLSKNYDWFFAEYSASFLESPEYIIRRQAITLLKDMLRDRSNSAVMTRYVSSSDNLRILMNLLRESSKSIQIEAFHVFKLFAVNENMPADIVGILVANRSKLLRLFADLKTHKEDDIFEADKAQVIREIAGLDS
ncbi:mo25 family protein [Artemisia annua]|uniref:Mo25 family protein n=1 Tax=Artemisia annua TaxID=35608 RepID=A0A2U1MPW7_ARTAN|nr:mo25 family protein [Artemisia annua]